MRAIRFVLALALFQWTGIAATAQEQLPTWTIQEEWRTRDGEPNQPEMYGIGSAVATHTGVLYVVQLLNHRVLAIDDRGQLIGSFGRKGGGPGEFERPGQLGLLGDSLWVLDAGLHRVTILPPGALKPVTRRYVDILPQLGADPQAMRPTLLRPTGVLANGQVVLETPLRSLPPQLRVLGRVDTAYLMLLDPQSRRIDTLTLFERRQPILEVDVLGTGQTRGMLNRFAANDLVAQDPYGRLLVAVSNRSPYPDSSRFVVTAWIADGRRAFQRQFPYTPRILTDEAIEAYLDEIRQRIQPGVAGAPVRLRVKEGPKAGEELPPVTGLVVGSDLSVWLGMTENRWLILGPDGRPKAEAILPRSTRRVLGAGPQHVWTLDEPGDGDSDGVRVLVRYRIVR